MYLSKKGQTLLETLEGCRLLAYQDSKGIWTIGVGHVGKEVVQGLRWTQDQADAALIADIGSIVGSLSQSFGALPQWQFDALVILGFNIGLTALLTSTVLKFVQTGESLKNIANAWLMWTKQPELTKRRLTELALFAGVL